MGRCPGGAVLQTSLASADILWNAQGSCGATSMGKASSITSEHCGVARPPDAGSMWTRTTPGGGRKWLPGWPAVGDSSPEVAAIPGSVKIHARATTMSGFVGWTTIVLL